MRASFDAFAADAWFRGGGHERDAMPLELLERDQILATIMPGHGGQPGDPGGSEAPDDDDSEDEEPEGDPS